jgi:hypothetical protein
MTDIPVTAKEFERWLTELRPAMPTDLYQLGQFALNALREIESYPQHAMNATQERGDSIFPDVLGPLVTFAESYGTWEG